AFTRAFAIAAGSLIETVGEMQSAKPEDVIRPLPSSRAQNWTCFCCVRETFLAPEFTASMHLRSRVETCPAAGPATSRISAVRQTEKRNGEVDRSLTGAPFGWSQNEFSAQAKAFPVPYCALRRQETIGFGPAILSDFEPAH